MRFWLLRIHYDGILYIGSETSKFSHHVFFSHTAMQNISGIPVVFGYFHQQQGLYFYEMKNNMQKCPVFSQ